MHSHQDDRRAAGRDDLMRGVRRHDKHVANDDALRVSTRDRGAAKVVRVNALLVDKLAPGYDVTGALEHDE